MGWHGFARMLTEVVGSLRDVLLPRGCAGCDMPDAVLCDDCRASGGGFMSFAMPGTVSGRAIACGAYRGPLRRAILRWKDHGDEECDGPFADMMADALLSSGLLASDPMPVTTLVPAPSSPRSMRERGRWHMRNVTNSLARSLRRRGMDVDTAALLRTMKTSGKSVQMHGAAQRSRRLQGHIVIAARPPYPRNVILVDDIVTTGTTARQCVQALNAAGIHVTTVICLARTLRAGEKHRRLAKYPPAGGRGHGEPEGGHPPVEPHTRHPRRSPAQSSYFRRSRRCG